MTGNRASVASSTELRMVVTRADGTVYDHGVVSAVYRNPLRRWWWDLFGERLANRRIRRSNRRKD